MGISSLGILCGYGVETVAGDKPASFQLLNRINSIGSISLEPESIDASALEDMITRSIAGREDSGSNFAVTVNMTDETIAEWETLISDYEALTGGLRMWFEVWSPYLAKSFFVVIQPPKNIPMPDFSQNELLTMEMTLTIEEYVGLDTPVKPA